MKSEYFQIIFLTILYNLIYLCALIFATGHEIGLKFEGNQLPAYILVCMTFFISFISFRIKSIQKRKLMVKIIGGLIILYLALFFSGHLSTNEAMFYFVIPIFGMPIFIFMFIAHYLSFEE